MEAQYNSQQPLRAILLKGPTPNSRTYFTALPLTLDALIAKARTLFPVPPDQTPHITLGEDEHAILLEDALPFLRDREVLHFRWAPDSPRKAALRVRWDPSVLGQGTQQAGAQPQTGQQQQQQQHQHQGRVPTQEPESRGSAARAAHARRVLQQQSEEAAAQAAAEAAAAASGAGGSSATLHAGVDAAPVSRQSQQPATSALSTSNAEQPGSSPPPYAAQERGSEVMPASPPVSTSTSASASVPASVPAPAPTIASPSNRDRRSDVATTETDETPNSPSRDPARTTAEEDTEAGMDVDVEKLSLAARPPETVTTADHETQHQGDGDEDRVERELSVQSSPEPETMAELGAEESVGPLEQGADSDLRPSPPSASQGPDGENEEVAGRQYHTMTSVVDALRHHPGNTAFRKPMSLDFLQFSEKNSRSVDLFSIASAIESRSYSNLSAFQADLALMWDNTRAFYGPRSPQAACAALLERFADAVLSEWTRPKAAKAGNGNGENNKADARERARAMLAAVGNGSPTRRGEKRPAEDLFMDLTAGSRKFLNTSNNSLLNGRRLSGRNTRGVRGGKSAGRAVGSAAAAAAAANGAGAAVRSKKAILALRDDEDDAQVFRAAAGRETEEEGVVAPTPTPAATAAEEETGKRLQEQEKSNGDVSTLEPDAMADGITNQGVPAPKGRKAGQRRRTRVVAYL